MKRSLLFLLVFFLIFSPAAARAAVFTGSGVELFDSRDGNKPGAINMDQAVKTAMDNNASVQIAQKNALIYDQQVRQYYSYLYPHLSLSGSYSRALRKLETILPEGFGGGGKVAMGKYNTAAGSADASLLLWAGGGISAAIKMGKMHSQSGSFQLTETQNQIKDTVRVLFFGVILSNALIKVQEENLNIAKDHLKEIETKYKQGLASDLDILSQKVKVSNSEPPLIQARNSYDLGILTLKRILNIDPDKNLYLTWQLDDVVKINIPTLAELYGIARENRPDLVIARLNTQMAEQDIKIARAQHYGEIRAFANATYSGSSDSILIPISDNNSSWGSSAGLRLNIPLFEGFRVASIVKQKQYAYDQAVLLEKDTEHAVKIEIKKAVLNFNEARQRFLATQGTIQQARKNLASMQLRFRNGLASRLDLDDAALLLHNAELQFVLAVHDAFTALSNLDYAVGKEVTLK